MISLVDNLFQPAVFPSADSISPILRPSCPFQGCGPDSSAGILFGCVSKELSCTPSKYSCQMRSGAAGPGTMMRTPVSAFETRLGPTRLPQADHEVSENGEELGEAPESNPVLIVVDANKEINTTALDWALCYVVQEGDSVKLLGVLQHIRNPMGYKSRADEKSWNGANRKVLDMEIAAHLAKFESIPNVHGRVEKIGAKLEIEVRAHLHSKLLVVEEAKRLSARYVVIDRHIKKDKKFYIENLNCYVTRVKSVTNFEHLRHGVPDSEQEIIDAGHDSPPVVPLTPALASTPSAQQCVNPARVPAISQQPQVACQQQWLPSPSSEFMTDATRPADYQNYGYTESVPSPSTLPGYLSRHGPATRTDFQMQGDGAMREHALRRWLSDSSQMSEMTDPALSSRASELAGHMAIGYPGGDSFLQQPPPSATSVTEEVLAEYMSNLCSYPGMRSALPPMSARKPDPNRASSRILIPSFKSSQSRHVTKSTRQSEYAAPGYPPESAVAELLSLSPANSSRHSSGVGEPEGPISVQPRRAADASWALDLLGVGNPEVQALAMPRNAFTPPVRTSSMRRAVSSQKHSPGAPPLCSLCGQQSPDFGKVKRFTFAELQNATNNFSGELYLAEGGYGSVYKGRLKEGQLVAVKQHKLASFQTDEQFALEIEALACAQHRNLVTLIGYCVENKLRLLVYEYICNGSLDRHLAPKSKNNLEWKNRLKIALGSARALRYLHEECRVGCIIHRDMRPNNILLTHDFTPMVGDFGLARRQPSGDREEETRVLGTIGYLAPEYAETGKITDKADVYAFGVVLLELISGRKAIDYSRPRDQFFLTEWARPLLDTYDKQLVDPRLRSNYDVYEMHCMMHAANQCIKNDPLTRPRMVQVLRILNPPEESDWTYSRGKNASLLVYGDGNQSEELSSCQLSSRGSQGGSCSASEASYSDLSDTDSLPRHPQQISRRFSRAKSGGKSLWKSFTRDKLLSNDSSRDIAAVNRMSVDDMSYSGML